jgi:signal transduction histidine kinase
VIGFRTNPHTWRRYDVVARDLPLAVLLTLAALVPALSGHGTRLGDVATHEFDAAAVAVVALECLPLAIRRHFPTACLALVSLGFAVDQLRGYHTVAGTALAIAVLSAGVQVDRYRRTVAVLASAAYGLLAISLDQPGTGDDVTEFALFYVAVVVLWSVGARLRLARDAEAERRRHVAEASRAAERTRIASELHDVVTHHVTAMVVQAESARYLSDPERIDQALSAVTDTGRRAVADLRQLLDLLNPDYGNQPRTAPVLELDALVEQTRQAGQPVQFCEEGERPDTIGSAEVAAYRVVQEALTNALKYAHGSRTMVRVQHGTKEICVDVSTESSRSHASPSGGSGRGLPGLGERVAVLGGEFTAGRDPEGRFVVRARIPVGSQA